MPDDARPFDAETVAERRAAEALVVDVDGFEGPLDLLLVMARTQKVDLRTVSILELAEQYLTFVHAARRLRIELAADYLVMAAWLAFLKSRLLLPPDPQEEGPSGEDLAAHLAFQLERLEAMRRAAARLMSRDQLGRDLFARGAEERVETRVQVTWDARLIDILKAYSRLKTKESFSPLHLERKPLMTMEMALEKMRSILGTPLDWSDLAGFVPRAWRNAPDRRRSALAATFAAALELAKSGELELRQEGTFAPISIRSRGDDGRA